MFYFVVFWAQMSMNYSLVQKALHAFDVTGSGLISPEDLKSVLSNFIFPMNERIFHGLFKRYHVTNTQKTGCCSDCRLMCLHLKLKCPMCELGLE